MSDQVLCPKCGHEAISHCREVEAIVINVEKYNETSSVLICEGRDEGRLCGCQYGDRFSTFGVYESKEQLDALIEQDRQQMMIVIEALEKHSKKYDLRPPADFDPPLPENWVGLIDPVQTQYERRVRMPLPGPESDSEPLTPAPESNHLTEGSD